MKKERCLSFDKHLNLFLYQSISEGGILSTKEYILFAV